MPIPVPQIQQFDIAPTLNAFASGQQTRIGLEDRQRDYERQAEEALFRAVDLADTPEKWNQLVTTLGQQFPDADLSEWTDFSTREAALGQSMSPVDRANLALSRQQLALQQANASRASRPTPYTDIARINADTDAGLISPEQADMMIAGLSTSGSGQSPYTSLGQIGADLENGFITPENAAALTAAELAGEDGGPDFDSEADLRAEFNKALNDIGFNESVASYGRIIASANEPSPAGDLALIFNYMKMLDPGSVVRESEFATAASARPILERLGFSWDAISAIWEGQQLTPTQRADFVNRAGQIYGSYLTQYNSFGRVFQNLASQQNLDPNRVVPQREFPTAPGGVAPLAPYEAPQTNGTGGQPGAAAAEAQAETWTHPDTGTQYRSGDRTTLNGQDVIIYRDAEGWYAVPTGSN